MINGIILYSEFISCNWVFNPWSEIKFQTPRIFEEQTFNLFWSELIFSNYSDVVYIQELIKIGLFKYISVVKWSLRSKD